MHGVNNGPICGSETMDLSRYFRKAGIPLVRLHDTDYPNPRQVDIPKVFPNFDADPEDPASYDFSHTDVYMAAIYACGARVLYRLGTSIEHMKNKVDIYPPKDYGKWARICCGIIRHYTRGWANGFTYDVPYWEIWNEPDNSQERPDMWIGAPETYYRLYVTAAKAIKDEFPEARVGGYAGCTVHNDDFREGFLSYVAKEQAPLDFYSWHGYSSHVRQLADDARLAKERLLAYGFDHTLSFCDEWNYIYPNPDFWITYKQEGSEYLQQELFTAQKSAFGASFVASSFIEMQNSPLDGSNYYDGLPSSVWCGLFNQYGVPQPCFYIFPAYDALYRLGGQAEVKMEGENVQCLAAVGEEEACVLLSNHDQEDTVCAIAMCGGTLQPDLDGKFGCGIRKADFYLIDDVHPLTLAKTEYYTGGKVVQYVPMGKNTVVLLRISRC